MLAPGNEVLLLCKHPVVSLAHMPHPTSRRSSRSPPHTTPYQELHLSVWFWGAGRWPRRSLLTHTPTYQRLSVPQISRVESAPRATNALLCVCVSHTYVCLTVARTSHTAAYMCVWYVRNANKKTGSAQCTSWNCIETSLRRYLGTRPKYRATVRTVHHGGFQLALPTLYHTHLPGRRDSQAAKSAQELGGSRDSPLIAAASLRARAAPHYEPSCSAHETRRRQRQCQCNSARGFGRVLPLTESAW